LKKFDKFDCNHAYFYQKQSYLIIVIFTKNASNFVNQPALCRPQPVAFLWSTLRPRQKGQIQGRARGRPKTRGVAKLFQSTARACMPA
jgi:hypothetical protein